MEQRLQKIISDYGIASRRSAEKLILDGKVYVNGIKANIGDKADVDLDEVVVDGKAIKTRPKRVYIMLNKPRGYVTTMSDEKNRRIVTDLIKEVEEKVYPVGRLDMDSEGLLLMTNDGEMTNKLTHPSYKVKKTYKAWVRGENIKKSADILRGEIFLDGVKLGKAQVKLIDEKVDSALLIITISEGKNRQVRRMCDIAGVKVTRLQRISESGLELGSLPKGKWRYLTEEEISHLKKYSF